jgi:hypothetical protein
MNLQELLTMTLQIELDPETEAWLVNEAGQRGIAPAKFISDLLRERIPRRSKDFFSLTPNDIDRISEVLSRGSENLPVLPPEVNNRESYYEDRW